MYKNFDEVIYVMNIASVVKVKECLDTVKSPKFLRDVLLSCRKFQITGIYGNLNYSIMFECMVPFAANEVPGIVAPFNCYLQVEATYNKKTKKYDIGVAYGPKVMLSATDPVEGYNVDYLYDVFSGDNPELDIKEFISDSFDFNQLCKTFKVAKISSSKTGETIYDDKE